MNQNGGNPQSLQEIFGNFHKMPSEFHIVKGLDVKSILKLSCPSCCSSPPFTQHEAT